MFLYFNAFILEVVKSQLIITTQREISTAAWVAVAVPAFFFCLPQSTYLVQTPAQNLLPLPRGFEFNTDSLPTEKVGFYRIY